MANTKTPIDQGLLARAIGGIKYVFTGERNQWFGPGDPLMPVAPEQEGVKGRRYDYPVSINTRWNPKVEDAGISYTQLRQFADSYDLLRLAIETRKDQVSKLEWSFANKDPKAVNPSPNIETLTKFFEYPDQEHDWDTWLRAFIEDMLVIDAATIYPRNTVGGEMYAMDLVDGATIKRLIDQSGRTPLPPLPAYQQILKGVVAADFNRDELVFRPRNVRTHKAYGYSPVEQVVVTVNIALRRQIHQLQYYTEGNVPEALIGVPDTWSPDHITQFQEYWDSILEGDTAARRHAKFVPGGMNPTFTKDQALKDDYDEWLARIICYAFNLSPSALTKAMNRATADTAHQQALEEGLLPLMKWIKTIMNYLIVKYFGFDDVEFKWEEEDDTSPEAQQKILTGYVQAKIMTDDEARDKLGMDPLTPEQRDQLAPAPMPGAIGPDGKPLDPNADPNAKPGEEKKPGDEEKDPKEETPAKKFVSSGLRKVNSRIVRNRKSVKSAVTSMETLLNKALSKAGVRIAKQLSKKIDSASKASNQDKADKYVATVTLPELKKIAPKIADHMDDIFADGGQLGLAQVLVNTSKKQLQQVNERAVTYANERAAELVTELEEATRDMIRSSVVAALEQGWTGAELADELEDSHAFSAARAEMIARTEMAFADIRGNLEGYKASGVVEAKQWSASQSDECEDCAALNDVIVGLDEDFPNDGGDGPPLHPHCACDVIPILKEDDE